MGGNGGGAAAADVEAEKEAPRHVVTNPAVAQQIKNTFVVISLVVIAMYAYVVFVHFSVDGPLWEAFAWSAGEAPLFFVPLCAVLMMRADIISIYAEEPSDVSAGSDLSVNLLGLDNV